MPQRGAPNRSAAMLTLALAFVSAALVGACRRQPTEVDEPVDVTVEVPDEDIDAPAICSAGCRRLERCVPSLASEVDGDPGVIAERLAQECDGVCASFEDRGSSLALRDCLNLDSCDAYWGCVAATSVRPWLAAVAPVGDRTCTNLCSQASACAIAKECKDAPEGKRTRPGKARPDSEDSEDAGDEPVDSACVRDQARRDELDERCVLQCEATPEDSRARVELIGCIDHGSCGGMLRCIDSWAETDYDDAEGPVPGISETCDAFCTRAIVCGAEQEAGELEPEELDELKQLMTSTYVECAVQCGKDLEATGDTARAAFDACTATETCEAFGACANEV